jgi:hypothetical protein
MSADSTAEPDDPADAPAVEVADRDEILDLLEDGIREAHRKVESGRVYDAENEKVRQKWIRTLAYAANAYRQLAKDRDLEELAEEVERLKQQHQAGGGGAGAVAGAGGN